MIGIDLIAINMTKLTHYEIETYYRYWQFWLTTNMQFEIGIYRTVRQTFRADELNVVISRWAYLKPAHEPNQLVKWLVDVHPSFGAALYVGDLQLPSQTLSLLSIYLQT